MAPHTEHYHFEDIAATRVHRASDSRPRGDRFRRHAPGDPRTGYDGWMTVELYPYIDNPDDAAREAKEYLSNVAQQVGVTLN